jgi:hypothetical protein
VWERQAQWKRLTGKRSRAADRGKAGHEGSGLEGGKGVVLTESNVVDFVLAARHELGLREGGIGVQGPQERFSSGVTQDV